MTNLHATYLNETQLAERWGISKKMLQKLRYQGGGPQFLKIGHLVRYSIANRFAFAYDWHVRVLKLAAQR